MVMVTAEATAMETAEAAAMAMVMAMVMAAVPEAVAPTGVTTKRPPLAQAAPRDLSQRPHPYPLLLLHVELA